VDLTKYKSVSSETTTYREKKPSTYFGNGKCRKTYFSFSHYKKQRVHLKNAHLTSRFNCDRGIPLFSHFCPICKPIIEKRDFSYCRSKTQAKCKKKYNYKIIGVS
jgi:hypothetical protein